MSDERRTPGAYVARVCQDTLRYAQELLDENERLSAVVESLEGDRLHLLAQVENLERDLEAHRSERGRLRRRLEAAERESHDFSGRYVDVERRNSDLAQLYVASYRLHATLDRRAVLEGVQDIVANLVGCEELAVFGVVPAGGALVLEDAFGVDAGFPVIPFGRGLIGRCVVEGAVLVPGEEEPPRLPHEKGLSACVPLMLEGRATGAIAVFRLLPQKRGIEDVDREIFELLATHAATALYCATLHARSAVGARG